ncbi:hypothetical protein [Amycolatopsis nigrescens]|uniref:hypothetical protein n=1 Tax=Amycolatopsis nigrescens TaxID=381445 RepID=UPI00037E0FBB|nr:hypothetical protein [Amycolatopsis nigrescens]
MADGYTVQAEKLNNAAKTHLGGLVQDLELARRKIESTAQHDVAFTAGDELFASTKPRWEEARHYLNRVFLDNIENLTLAAEALHEVAERYVEAERAGVEGMPS